MIDLDVPDVSNERCTQAIRKAVAGVDAGATCDVDLGGKQVHIVSAMPPSDFIEALEAAGYPSTLVPPIKSG